MTEAFEKALTNPKVIALVASLTAKEMVKSKSNPTNIEETLVRDHVVFAQKGSESGVFMTTKEVTEKILAFNDELTIRPRIFGKSLISEAEVTKDSSHGRVYMIEAVVEKITAKLLDTIIKAADVKNIDVKDVKEIASKDVLESQDSPLNYGDLDDMDLSELLEVKAAYELKIKKAKKMDADELRAIIRKTVWPELDSNGAKEKEETPELDANQAALLLEEYGDTEEYSEILKSFSRKKLIKHINEYKMPVRTEEKTEDEIVASILELLAKHATTPPAKTEQVEDEKKSKKDKKKKKKKKKAKS